jgi:hypothetical protein
MTTMLHLTTTMITMIPIALMTTTPPLVFSFFSSLFLFFPLVVPRTTMTTLDSHSHSGSSSATSTIQDAPQLPPSAGPPVVRDTPPPFALPVARHSRLSPVGSAWRAWLDAPSLALAARSPASCSTPRSRSPLGADAVWSRAAEPYRVLLERFYCFDMIFECMRIDDARLSARRRATLLARSFALDAVEDAYSALKVIDQGGESFVYVATPAPKKSSAVYQRMERHLRHGEPVALVKAMRFTIGDAAESAHAPARGRHSGAVPARLDHRRRPDALPRRRHALGRARVHGRRQHRRQADSQRGAPQRAAGGRGGERASSPASRSCTRRTSITATSRATICCSVATARSRSATLATPPPSIRPIAR